WTTNGDGAFDDATLLAATYTPGAADIVAGTATLTITTDDPPGPCPAASDGMILTINPGATASAGADATICEGSPFTLSGAIGGSATNSTWSTAGDGTFDNVALLAATYTPGAGDIAAGTITLIITTNDPDGAGPCLAVSDDMILTINPTATTNAGADATICEGSTHTLAGSIGGSATSSTWTTSGDGTFDNVALLTGTYTPGAADIAAGSITLTITTNDPDGAGPCLPETDDMILTINPAATANAGTDATICEGSSFTLSGSIGGSATSLTWTTAGDGSFDNPALPAATYTPGAGDIAAGIVTLTITTDDPDGEGPWVVAIDDMILTISPAATANAGANATICEGSTHTMAGSIGGSATSSTWSTSGDGTFDNAALLAATYTPGVADIAGGSVTLTITTDDPDGAGPCLAVSDDMILT
ncbi:MAG: hypothetical protein AAB834_07900, partial [Patescibacteria group bacterium]